MGIYGHFSALHWHPLDPVWRSIGRQIERVICNLDLDVQIAEEMERILTKYLVWVGLNNLSQRQSRFLIIATN